ncbi:hypothetical protein V8C42DRAFT_337605 [Trichoderma barbatum]
MEAAYSLRGWLSLPPEIKIKITNHLDNWSAFSAAAAGCPLSKKKEEDTRYVLPWAAIFKPESDWVKVFGRQHSASSYTEQSIRELFLVGEHLKHLQHKKRSSERCRHIHLVLLALGRQGESVPCPASVLANLQPYEQISGGVFITKSNIKLYFAKPLSLSISDTTIRVPLNILLRIGHRKTRVLAFNQRRKLTSLNVKAGVVHEWTTQGHIIRSALQYRIRFPRYGQIGTLSGQAPRSTTAILQDFLECLYPNSEGAIRNELPE